MWYLCRMLGALEKAAATAAAQAAPANNNYWRQTGQRSLSLFVVLFELTRPQLRLLSVETHWLWRCFWQRMLMWTPPIRILRGFCINQFLCLCASRCFYPSGAGAASNTTLACCITLEWSMCKVPLVRKVDGWRQYKSMVEASIG